MKKYVIILILLLNTSSLYFAQAIVTTEDPVGIDFSDAYIGKGAEGATEYGTQPGAWYTKIEYSTFNYPLDISGVTPGEKLDILSNFYLEDVNNPMGTMNDQSTIQFQTLVTIDPDESLVAYYSEQNTPLEAYRGAIESVTIEVTATDPYRNDVNMDFFNWRFDDDGTDLVDKDTLTWDATYKDLDTANADIITYGSDNVFGFDNDPGSEIVDKLVDFAIDQFFEKIPNGAIIRSGLELYKGLFVDKYDEEDLVEVGTSEDNKKKWLKLNLPARTSINLGTHYGFESVNIVLPFFMVDTLVGQYDINFEVIPEIVQVVSRPFAYPPVGQLWGTWETYAPQFLARTGDTQNVSLDIGFANDVGLYKIAQIETTNGGTVSLDASTGAWESMLGDGDQWIRFYDSTTNFVLKPQTAPGTLFEGWYTLNDNKLAEGNGIEINDETGYLTITDIEAFDDVGNKLYILKAKFSNPDLTDPVVQAIVDGDWDGQVVVDGTVQVEGWANDGFGSGIKQIRIYLDFILVDSLDDPAQGVSLYWTWNTLTTPNGDYEITVEADDYVGNSASSTTLVTVFNDVLGPSLSFSNPSNNEIVSDYLLISVYTSDPSGVDKIYFYVDNVYQATDYNPSWSWLMNTKSWSNGFHVIKIRGYDNLGNWSEKSVNIFISNGRTISPF